MIPLRLTHDLHSRGEFRTYVHPASSLLRSFSWLHITPFLLLRNWVSPPYSPWASSLPGQLHNPPTSIPPSSGFPSADLDSLNLPDHLSSEWTSPALTGQQFFARFPLPHGVSSRHRITPFVLITIGVAHSSPCLLYTSDAADE